MSKLPIHHIIDQLAADAGSDAEFMRQMAKAGGSLSHLTLRGWRRGATPNKPAHMLAISQLSGKPAEEILQAAIPDADAAAA